MGRLQRFRVLTIYFRGRKYDTNIRSEGLENVLRSGNAPGNPSIFFTRRQLTILYRRKNIPLLTKPARKEQEEWNNSPLRTGTTYRRWLRERYTQQ